MSLVAVHRPIVGRTDPTRSARWTAFFRQWLSTSYPAPEPGQPVAKPQINADNVDRYPLTGEEDEGGHMT